MAQQRQQGVLGSHPSSYSDILCKYLRYDFMGTYRRGDDMGTFTDRHSIPMG